MKISRFLVHAALGLVGLFVTSSDAHAAIITWGAATTISGDSDVLTTGTKVGAFNLGGSDVPSTTVNGVNFDAFTVFGSIDGRANTSGNFTVTAYSSGTSGFGSTSAPFANLSANYQTLLQTAAINEFNSSGIILTMNGLTAGTRYSFQWWSNDAALKFNTAEVTATSGSTVRLDPNTTNTNGGMGQFAIGTFTADSASQVVNFNASGRPVLNAFQLRAVTTPEPSTYAMIALGLVALCVLGAKRKKDSQAV